MTTPEHMPDTSVTNVHCYEQLLEGQADTYAWPTLDENDACALCYTSGTTGNPKGATLTHRNVVNNARYIAMAMRLTHEDALCIPVPLYHCFGMVMGNLACLTHAARAIFPDEGFDPNVVLRTVSEEKCTALHFVPTMFLSLIHISEPTRQP